LKITMTRGGERHTVTEFSSFGLGCISAINALVFPAQDPTAVPAVCDDPLTFASGATVPGGNAIRPGESISFTGLSKGVHRFMCMIHPWMKTTVAVR
jgi:plastocyanin